MDALLELLYQAGEAACMQATWLLLKVLHNVALYPEERKYRKLRTNSETVGRLLQTPGVTEFLLHTGFQQGADHFILPSPDFALVGQAIDALIKTRRRFNTLEGYEIFKADLELGGPLGSGKFGDVFEGRWKGLRVAVKTLKPDGVSEQAFKEFEREANVMKAFKHQNVMGLLGVLFNAERRFLVLELMTACFQDVLRDETFTVKELLDKATHVAAGMEYVHHHDVLHCDLATRNVLLSPSGTLKISDFGLARFEGTPECDLTGQPVKFPIRWTAPEVFTKSILTKASDIWSYGILFYEVMTAGDVPYAHLSNKETKEEVRKGYRLPAPEGCPSEFYSIMLECWNADPKARPPFRFILQQLFALKMGFAREEKSPVAVALSSKSVKRRKKMSLSALPWFRSNSKPVVSAAIGDDAKTRDRSNTAKDISRKAAAAATAAAKSDVDFLRVHTSLVALDQIKAVVRATLTMTSTEIIAMALKKAGKGEEEPVFFVLVALHPSEPSKSSTILEANAHPLAFSRSAAGQGLELYICPADQAHDIHRLIGLRREEEVETYVWLRKDKAAQNNANGSAGQHISAQQRPPLPASGGPNTRCQPRPPSDSHDDCESLTRPQPVLLSPVPPLHVVPQTAGVQAGEQPDIPSNSAGFAAFQLPPPPPMTHEILSGPGAATESTTPAEQVTDEQRKQTLTRPDKPKPRPGKPNLPPPPPPPVNEVSAQTLAPLAVEAVPPVHTAGVPSKAASPPFEADGADTAANISTCTAQTETTTMVGEHLESGASSHIDQLQTSTVANEHFVQPETGTSLAADNYVGQPPPVDTRPTAHTKAERSETERSTGATTDGHPEYAPQTEASPAAEPHVEQAPSQEPSQKPSQKPSQRLSRSGGKELGVEDALSATQICAACNSEPTGSNLSASLAILSVPPPANYPIESNNVAAEVAEIQNVAPRLCDPAHLSDSLQPPPQQVAPVTVQKRAGGPPRIPPPPPPSSAKALPPKKVPPPTPRRTTPLLTRATGQLDVQCAARPPQAPSGTVAGIALPRAASNQAQPVSVRSTRIELRPKASPTVTPIPQETTLSTFGGLGVDAQETSLSFTSNPSSNDG